MIRIQLEPWMDKADCVGHDPDLWFPQEGAAAAARQAKMICRQCPVREECLRYAITQQIKWGIWGGLTYRERLKITVRRRAPGQCVNGHHLNDRTSYVNYEGHRVCRVCRRIRQGTEWLTDNKPNKGLAGRVWA